MSASDRCNTIRALSDPATLPEGLNRPGHIFPLRARPGGVRVRPGHTEAAVDLCLLAGCRPVGEPRSQGLPRSTYCCWGGAHAVEALWCEPLPAGWLAGWPQAWRQGLLHIGAVV